MRKFNFNFTTRLLAAFIIIQCSPANSINSAAQAPNQNDERRIKLAYISYPSETSNDYTLDIFFRASYHTFSFIKKDTLYTSRYQVSISLTEQKSQFYKNEVVNGELKVSQFNDTKNRENYVAHKITFSIPPNTYITDVQIEDKESSRSFSEQYTITVDPSRKDSIGISSPLFIRLPLDQKNLPDFFPTGETIITNYEPGFHAYIKLYKETPNPTALLHWTILTENNASIHEEESDISPSGKIVARELPIRGSQVPSGKYVLLLSLQSGSLRATNKYKFSVLWRNKPISALNMKDAARQMEYILPKNQFDVLMAKEGKEQEELFAELWKNEDPTPSTAENQLMEEYYYRVDYANLRYQSSFADGWKTDRGRIFILLGPPDAIKRRYREFDTPPYESWEYTALNRKYIFADQNNTGDFKLVNIMDE